MEVNELRLFINKGICKRKWNGNVSVRQKDGIVTLRIPNYDEATKEQTYVEFIIPNAKRKMLKTVKKLAHGVGICTNIKVDKSV